MKEYLFGQADKELKEINDKCAWAAYERNTVYSRFKDNVCGMLLTKTSKGITLDDLNKWINATEFVCPETKDNCERLRKLLGQGSTIKCGT